MCLPGGQGKADAAQATDEALQQSLTVLRKRNLWLQRDFRVDVFSRRVPLFLPAEKVCQLGVMGEGGT